MSHRQCISGYYNVKSRNSIGIWTPEECYQLFTMYYQHDKQHGDLKHIIIPNLMEIFGRTKIAIINTANYTANALVILTPKMYWLNKFDWYKDHKEEVCLKARELRQHANLIAIVKKAAKLGLITYQLC